jgi:hypothetical protein
LLIPEYYKRFKPGAPPQFLCFPEIKIVPTRQFYYNLPIAEATKKYLGKTKLNDAGIMREETYIAGFPFPRPEGKFKANQIISNWQKRYLGWENQFIADTAVGWGSSFREDWMGQAEMYIARGNGRVAMEPLGWFDERAQKQGEAQTWIFNMFAPRDNFGNVILSTTYLDPEKYDQMMIYINALRRVRVLSTTDIQDSLGGSDAPYCDNQMMSQKLSEKIFPYKCELIAEREYLFPFLPSNGSSYLSSKGLELHGYEWERRPMYVVKMTCLDTNFIYKDRILYIDKEMFVILYIENYNKKGRLYRTADHYMPFNPDLGFFTTGDMFATDFIDNHCTLSRLFQTPAPWLRREHLSLGALVGKGK